MSGSKLKIYTVADGPPSLAVRLSLLALEVPFDLVDVDYFKGQHLTEEYAKMNPSREIPVMDDDGFYLSESVAIIQYLFDKYGPEDSPYYPKDAKKRAIVNHRLLFNTCFYYNAIAPYAMAPIFYDYPRDENGLKRVKLALSTFETYLKQQNTKYAAGDHVTVGDFALISATVCLDAIGMDLAEWPLVKKWYETFQKEQVPFWSIASDVRALITHFDKNSPDMSQMNHPFHPKKK